MPNSIPRARRLHRNLTVQVLTAIFLGVMLGILHLPLDGGTRDRPE